MIQTTDELRQMVVNVVKVKENTDPTKTQGSRLRQLLYNILDTVEDLVEKQGLSVYQGVMQELDAQQDSAIMALRNEVTALIEAIPDHSIYALKEDIKQTLASYVLSNNLSTILADYAKTINIPAPFSKQYSELIGKPDLTIYQLKSDSVTYDLTKYALKADIPTVPTYDLTPYALKTQIPTIPTYDFTIYQKTTDNIAYSRITGAPTIITSYTQLTDKPTIPASQVNADWSATSGVSMINNKPTLFDGKYTSLTLIPTTFTPSTHTHTISDITGLQTTLNTITKFYTSAGIVNQNIKKWTGIITPTTSQGFSIDISSAGFTQILGVQIQVERNSTVVSDVPQVAIKTKSNTAITVNITQTNTAVVSIAGINVLSGLPLIFATNLSNILLHIEVTGY